MGRSRGGGAAGPLVGSAWVGPGAGMRGGGGVSVPLGVDNNNMTDFLTEICTFILE